MYSKVHYMIVGIFVLLFGVGMVIFAFWLANYGLERDFCIYKLKMKESITGLSQDSSVKFRGVDIGKVSEIRINPENIEEIEIFLKIKRGIPIKEDMIATTQMFGITGLLSINIEGGTNEAKTLEPSADYIPLIQTAPSFVSKLSDTFGGLGDRLSILLSKHNLETLSSILDKFEKATEKAAELEQKAISSLDEADITLKEFRVSMSNLSEKFAKATDDFELIQKDFADIKKVGVPTIDKLMQTATDFRRVTLKVEKSLDRGDYNFKKILEPMLIEVQILTNQLTSMTRQLKQNPSEILFKSRKQRRGPGE